MPEPDLRTLICKTLISHGFKVQSASNGAEGLALIESGSRFDLIVSDVMMPVMTGSALKRELQMRGISARMLFLSGYAEDALFGTNLAETDIDMDFLPKPFNASTLMERVQAMLQ